MRFVMGFFLAILSGAMALFILDNLSPQKNATPVPVASASPEDETTPAASQPAVVEVAVTEFEVQDIVEPVIPVAPELPTAEDVIVQEQSTDATNPIEVEQVDPAPAQDVEVTEEADPAPEVLDDVIEEQTDLAQAQTTPRLPTIGGEQGSSNLIDRRRGDDDEIVEEDAPALPNLSTPFVQFATESEASLLPQIGILLEPEGEIDLEISEISLPVSILVSGTDANAKLLYQDARDSGIEVFLTLRPEDALTFDRPTLADVSLQAAFQEMPEAIGYAQDPITEIDRATKNAALRALANLGRGYLEFSSGLISGAFGGNASLLPSGVIELGVTGDVTASSISRALDRASLLAAQAGSTILILPLKQQTLDALVAFQSSQKGNTTALMPVSRIINP